MRKKLNNAVPSFRILLSFENVTEKQAIEAYFNSGFNYNVFLCFLRKYDGIQISLSTLKRLSEYDPKRKKDEVD